MTEPNEFEEPDGDHTPTSPRITLEDCRQSGLASFFRNGIYSDDTFYDTFQGGLLRDGLPFFRPGSISLWIGTMANKQALKMYIDLEDLADVYCDLDPQINEFSPFATDLGFLPTHPEQIWSRFFDEGLAPDKLLAATPDSGFFILDAVKSCQRLGILFGNSVICYYNLDFHGRRALFAFGALRFVGSFLYPGHRPWVSSPEE